MKTSVARVKANIGDTPFPRPPQTLGGAWRKVRDAWPEDLR